MCLPEEAMGAFEAEIAPYSSLYPAPRAHRKSINGVWVILKFHEKKLGGRGLMVWGIKLAQYKNPCLIGIGHPSSISLPCFPCLLLLRLPQWRAYLGKACPFFPFSFEVAWRLRIARLKVIWFPLKFQAAWGLGNYAVYEGCCCACQTVQCVAAEAERMKKTRIEGQRHYMKRL